jgi:hypothetical protein
VGPDATWTARYSEESDFYKSLKKIYLVEAIRTSGQKDRQGCPIEEEELPNEIDKIGAYK